MTTNVARLVLDRFGPDGAGWSSRGPHGLHGQVCLIVACDDLHTNGAYDITAYRSFVRRCAEVVRAEWPRRTFAEFPITDATTVALFNDHWETNFDDVRTLLEKVEANS